MRPCRDARRGVTLVELLVSMLILTIVCIAWLEIIGIQSARKESRRREAVERLSGMMDAFLYSKRNEMLVSAGSYWMDMALSTGTLVFRDDSGTNVVHSLFLDGSSPIGYQLCVVEAKNLPDSNRFSGWKAVGRGATPRWLVGRLYHGNGSVRDVGKPFFSLPVCLGF